MSLFGASHNSSQASAALVARPSRVWRALVIQSPVLAVLTGVPALAAVAEEQRALAIALVLPTLVLVLVAIWSRQVKQKPDLRRIEALVTLALIFLVSALLVLPAFIVLGMRPLDAFFEGVSGITTTGLSMARDAEQWPVSAHLLRAWLQWCGGVVVAVAGVALLMDSGRAAQVLGRASVGQSDYLSSTRQKARLILLGYSGLTVIGVVGATLLIPGNWEGAMVALAAVSTGGFTPRDTSLAEYGLPAQVFIMSLCVAGAISLLFYALALRRGLRQALASGTVTTTLAVIAGGLLLHVSLEWAREGWQPEELIVSALNHVSAQTTAGFSAGPVAAAGPFMLILLAAMIVGGDVGSTTGGMKMGRVVTLAAMVSQIFLKFRLPEKGVSHVKIDGHKAATDRIVFAAALVSIYGLCALAFWLALLLGGYAPLPAIFDAVSALSGVGLSAGVIGPDLAAPLKALAIFAMLLGRLEFFALFVLILPSTWISRR